MRSILAILTMLTISPALQAQTTPHIQSELIADTAAVQPGKPFQIGLHLRIEEGWHVYWTNPGDAGAPTTLKLSVPDGFAVGPVQYPVPEKLSQPGNLTIYAYEHELLLAATVTPPLKLPDGPITIRATASWCVCNPDICILGKRDLILSLPVGSNASPSDQSSLFDAWAPRMPACGEKLFHHVTMGILMTDDFKKTGSTHPSVNLTWNPPATQFQWLPGPCDDLNVTATEITEAGHTTSIYLTIAKIQGIPPDSSTVDGILAYDVQGQARGVAVSLDRKLLYLPVPDQPAAAK